MAVGRARFAGCPSIRAKAGGLGLAMVQAMADEMLYNEAQNEVVLVKYLA